MLSSKQLTRKRARQMVDEDDNATTSYIRHNHYNSKKIQKSRSSTNSDSRRNSSKASPATSTPPTATTGTDTSPKLALKFGGKVYRTLDPQDNYSTDGNFLGEPDETITDLLRDQAEAKRRALERDLAWNKSNSKFKEEMEPYKEDDLKVTPVKRKIFDSAPSPSSPSRRSAPPSHDATLRSSLGLGLPFTETKSKRASPPSPNSSPSSSSSSSLLPAPLASLLALHVTLESALLLHLANEGSSVASSTSQTNDHGEAVIRIANLITYPELRGRVEGSGKSFSEKDLARLVWVWEGCGLRDRPAGEGDVEGSCLVGRNPCRDDDEEEEEEDDDLNVEKGESGGMGFLITKTRTGSTKGVVSTYGIGINVALRANPQLPTFELLPPHSPGRSSREPRQMPASPGSVGRGREGMSVVALWSQGTESRRAEFTRRVREWGAQFPDDAVHRDAIPRATLPSLAAAIPIVPGTHSPSKRQVASDVFGPVIPIASHSSSVAMLSEGKKLTKTAGSAAERMKELAARLKAKANARSDIIMLADGALSGKKSLKRDKDIGTTLRKMEMEMSQRRVYLSRLGNVADGVKMLFDRGNSKTKLLSEVAAAIVKSPLIALSADEAKAALGLLCELCPGFTYIKSVERQDWLCMKGQMGLRDVKERVKQELAA
ncbi:hypothetical protein T439DRAFT_183174 [Meredithblackwellia eburnea MCA 4105]